MLKGKPTSRKFINSIFLGTVRLGSFLLNFSKNSAHLFYKLFFFQAMTRVVVFLLISSTVLGSVGPALASNIKEPSDKISSNDKVSTPIADIPGASPVVDTSPEATGVSA